MKLSFYAPSDVNREKNVAHINYIIRREAVDYGVIEPENKNNVEAAKQELEREDLIHLQYMDERPKSEGLFDENGNANIKDVKEALNNHEGIVWRCIVSLREDEAVRINHLDRSIWEENLRMSFHEISNKLGIPESNLYWTAAYHPEPGHPHCHILFWERKPSRTQGKLSDGEIRDMKKTFIKNIYSQERERLFIEKTFYRDAVRDGVRDVLGLKKQLDKEQNIVRSELGTRISIAPKLSLEQEQILRERLQELSKILPGHGRVALKLMPKEVKENLREITDWLLQQPYFKQEVEKYLQAHLEITQVYTTQESHLNKAKDNAYNDLKDRVAQDLLKGAVQIQQEKREKQFTQFNICNYVWKGVWESIQRERSKSEYQARVLEAKRELEERKRREGRGR